MNGTLKWWASAGATLLVAGLTGMLLLNSKVEERQTAAQVEHLIDLKMQDKYAEIIRRLERIEVRLAVSPQVDRDGPGR